MSGPADEGADSGDGDYLTDFWRVGAGLNELTFQPFAADDPEALPRRLGKLPDDPDGIADRELRRLYALLADAAEHEALKVPKTRSE